MSWWSWGKPPAAAPLSTPPGLGTPALAPKVWGPPNGPEAVLQRVILPTLTTMAREDHVRLDPRATRMLLAIAGQEADWRHRDQLGRDGKPGVIGPATGLWQFERAGGVKGVLRHSLTAAIARRWCERADVPPEADAVWRALVTDDALACAFARLLLLTDPNRLPDAEDAGWAAYIWCWRPGKPHRDRWSKCWATATALVPSKPGAVAEALG